MVKYKQVYIDTLKAHRAEFESFRVIHDLFKADQKKYSKHYNIQGKKIRDYLDRAVNILCGKTESSGHGAFSSVLADRFWEEVRRDYPMVDFIGVTFE